MDAGEYSDAAACFEKSKSYKDLIIAYEKMGYYSTALGLAEKHSYYELGAEISLKIKDKEKAAYFYSYFAPNKAAKLYREEGQYYKAGFCYLAMHNAIDAISMFSRVVNNEDREYGLKLVSEYALTLFFNKSYNSACKIFFALEDYYSALECAKRMHDETLTARCRILIGIEEAENRNYKFAAKCVEPYDCERAISYYALAGDYKSEAKIFIKNKEYDKAIQVCMIHNDLNSAYKIAAINAPDMLGNDNLAGNNTVIELDTSELKKNSFFLNSDDNFKATSTLATIANITTTEVALN